MFCFIHKYEFQVWKNLEESGKTSLKRIWREVIIIYHQGKYMAGKLPHFNYLHIYGAFHL